jgi:hypothetical protein
MVSRSLVRQLKLGAMTTWRRTSLSFLPGIAILFTIAAPTAMAVPVTYTFTAICSGTIGSTPFTNVLVTVTATGDTSAIFQGEMPPYDPNTFFNPTQLSVNIPGVGTANFTGTGNIAGYGTLANGYVFDNQPESVIGFGVASDDSDNSGTAFATYNLSSAIGPTSSVSLNFGAETTMGELSLTTVTPGTFTAVLPGTPTIGGVPLSATLTFTNPTAAPVVPTASIPVQIPLSLAAGSATLATDDMGNVIGLTAADIDPFPHFTNQTTLI